VASRPSAGRRKRNHPRGVTPGAQIGPAVVAAESAEVRVGVEAEEAVAAVAAVPERAVVVVGVTGGAGAAGAEDGGSRKG